MWDFAFWGLEIAILIVKDLLKILHIGFGFIRI